MGLSRNGVLCTSHASPDREMTRVPTGREPPRIESGARAAPPASAPGLPRVAARFPLCKRWASVRHTLSTSVGARVPSRARRWRSVGQAGWATAAALPPALRSSSRLSASFPPPPSPLRPVLAPRLPPALHPSPRCLRHRISCSRRPPSPTSCWGYADGSVMPVDSTRQERAHSGQAAGSRLLPAVAAPVDLPPLLPPAQSLAPPPSTGPLLTRRLAAAAAASRGHGKRTSGRPPAAASGTCPTAAVAAGDGGGDGGRGGGGGGGGRHRRRSPGRQRGQQRR